MPSVKRVTQPPTPIVSSPAPPEFPPTTEDQFSAHPPPLRASDDYPDLRLLEEFNASQSFDDIFRDVLFGDVPAVSGNLDDATTLEQAVVNPGLDLVVNQRIVTPDIDPSAEKVSFNLDLYGATEDTRLESLGIPDQEFAKLPASIKLIIDSVAMSLKMSE